MKILYYDGGDRHKRNFVKAVLEELHHPYTMIEQNQGNHTLDDLLKNRHLETANAIPLPSTDLIVFEHGTDAQILEVSQALVKHKAHVELKCIVTKTNRKWQFCDLLAEVMEEQAYFVCRRKCQELIQEVASFREDDYTNDSWNAYEAAFMKGAMLFQKKQSSKRQFEEVIYEITQAKECLVKK